MAKKPSFFSYFRAGFRLLSSSVTRQPLEIAGIIIKYQKFDEAYKDYLNCSRETLLVCQSVHNVLNSSKEILNQKSVVGFHNCCAGAKLATASFVQSV